MDDRIRPIKRETSREEAVIKGFACVFMLAVFVGIPCLVVARVMDGCAELSREWHEAGVRARENPSPIGGSRTLRSAATFCVDAGTYDQVTDSAVYGDLTTIDREVRSGRAVLLPAGTQVNVIGSAGFLQARVRVTSGPYAGQEGVMDAGAVLP